MKKCFILAVIVTALFACNNNDTQRDNDNNNDNMRDTLQVMPPDSNVSYPADTSRPDPSFPR